MQCFTSPDFWVYLIVLIGGIMIIRIVIPWVISFFAFPAPIGQVLMIILCIFGGGIHLPTLQPHR
jgi:hypothetical protein